MPATDYQGSFSSSPLTTFGRSIFNFTTMEVSSLDQGGHVLELEAFQRHVAEQFADISSAGDDEFLSLAWVRRLLDAFISCHEEFRNLVAKYNHDNYCVNKPQMERLIGEYYERSVKALDVCNAIRDGIEQIRQWERLLEIVLSALDNNHSQRLGEAQIRRAKKALIDLTIGMLDDQKLSHRNRSFGRNKEKTQNLGSHLRSLSWSVSRSWSAAKQLQAMSSNLHPPRGGEGVAAAVYTMSAVMTAVMWAVVAAVPCHDRGSPAMNHVSIPKQYGWARAVSGMQDRVGRRRSGSSSCVGLLREVAWIERWAREMMDLLQNFEVVRMEDDEKEGEIRRRVGEMKRVFDAMKVGLTPLESKVREVFHRIVRSRTEGMDCRN